ncbi:MAG TPA: ferritin-like domain-containing protein, partial [Vicinamibacterales bacterium]|nr:ferritin-like domain-containing protein [Vicinamibacterales bacterium]
ESDALEAAFTSHLRQTEKQVTRLEQVFRMMGEKPRGKRCDGIMGIVEEGNRVISELEGPVRDAALIAGAQKAEHYEIAAYGTLTYFAELLGNEKAKNLLGETLEEEKTTDQKLTELAKSDVNRQALVGGNRMEDHEPPMTSLTDVVHGRPNTRRASSMGRRANAGANGRRAR